MPASIFLLLWQAKHAVALLVTIANALCKNRQKWVATAP